MNDFTKDELKLIHDGLSYAAGASLENGSMIKDVLYPVAKKIQSMIDNYCEHENKPHKKLLIKSIQINYENKYDVIFKWEGLKGERRMIIEMESEGFSLTIEGVKDIRRMCNEFIYNKDYSDQYLKVVNDWINERRAILSDEEYYKWTLKTT